MKELEVDEDGVETLVLVDGQRITDVDEFIYCTGYLFHFPWMDPALALQTRCRSYSDNLYRGVFLNKDPRMIYIGSQVGPYTFHLFDAQAWLAKNYIIGKYEVPDQETMQADIDHWLEKLDTCADTQKFQTDYLMHVV